MKNGIYTRNEKGRDNFKGACQMDYVRQAGFPGCSRFLSSGGPDSKTFDKWCLGCAHFLHDEPYAPTVGKSFPDDSEWRAKAAQLNSENELQAKEIADLKAEKRDFEYNHGVNQRALFAKDNEIADLKRQLAEVKDCPNCRIASENAALTAEVERLKKELTSKQFELGTTKGDLKYHKDIGDIWKKRLDNIRKITAGE